MDLAFLLERGVLAASVESCAFDLCTRRQMGESFHWFHLHAYVYEGRSEGFMSAVDSLVPIFAEDGNLCEAAWLFDRLVTKDEYCWNSLVRGYANCGEIENAFLLYNKMLSCYILPNAYTFVVLLQTCARLKDFEQGYNIHKDITKSSLLEGNQYVGTSLVDMYAKFGNMKKAHEVFDRLPLADIVTWNALMTGYAKHGWADETLDCFRKMQVQGMSPNCISFLSCLQVCGATEAVERGQELHMDATQRGLERDPFVCNALVDMYCKCSLHLEAQNVFGKISARSIVLWNALITGYHSKGLDEEALSGFKQMQHEGVIPDGISFVCTLNACGGLHMAEKGRTLHAALAGEGLLEENMLVSNALIDMYAKCGLVEDARQVFDDLQAPDVVSCNALIAGYVDQGCSGQALNYLEWMQSKGILPDAVTFVCSLKACGDIRDADKAQELHREIARKGYLARNDLVGNALVAMYAKCGLLDNAQEVFQNLPRRGIVSWTELIGGFTRNGFCAKAMLSFEQMQAEGILPNVITYVCMMGACSTSCALKKVQELHAKIVRDGSVEGESVIVGGALVDMYAKCGLLETAAGVLQELPVRDTITWNAVILGYINHGLSEKALQCLKEMQLDGASLNHLTFACGLKACADIRWADKGLELHAEIAKSGWLEDDLICNVLVDMYVKCGLLTKAREVFDRRQGRDIVSWTSLISGYAEHDHGKEALKLVEQMQLEGISLNAATIVCSLKASGSVGSTSKTQEVHLEIAKRGLEEDILVSSTLINTYNQCGLLLEAEKVFDEQSGRDIVSWNSLLTGYTKLGKMQHVFDTLQRMITEGEKPDAVTRLVLLSACGSCAGLRSDFFMSHGQIIWHSAHTRPLQLHSGYAWPCWPA